MRALSASASHLKVVAILLVAIVPIACTTSVNPLQERAYNAFKDCQWNAPAPTAQITEMREDGRFNYSAAPGDVARMKKCLEERYGYRFQ